MATRLRRESTRLIVCAALLASAAPAAADSTSLELRGITFVASHSGQRELLLRSSQASFDLETRTAALTTVSAEVVDTASQRELSIECERAVVDVQSQDFSAEGNVRGLTAEGQLFTTEAVRYDRATGLLSSESAVELTDTSGSLRGDGFRYDLGQRRFELLGNVRVEQGP